MENDKHFGSPQFFSVLRPSFWILFSLENDFQKLCFCQTVTYVSVIICLTEQICFSFDQHKCLNSQYILRRKCNVSCFTCVLIAELQLKEHFSLFCSNLCMLLHSFSIRLRGLLYCSHFTVSVEGSVNKRLWHKWGRFTFYIYLH